MAIDGVLVAKRDQKYYGSRMSGSGIKHHLPGFDQALDTLREDVTLMANLVSRNLANARAGFGERDEDFSAAVIADDDEVDLLEKQVDRLGTDILMRYQPMITDLRTVLATIKLSNILERASNHAVSIARRSRKLAEDPSPADERESLLTHFDAVVRLFSEAVLAFRDVDAVVAGRVLGRTESLASAGREFVENFTERLEERPFGSRTYVSLMAVAQSLEEITYLAEHIANEIVYIAEARDIRHPRNTLAETEETSR
jgi:phosphate transport system protein